MVLQAKRNYAKTIAREERRRTRKAPVRKELPKDNKQDSAYGAQQAEFGVFLEQAIKKDRPFQFLIDMAKKHMDGELFTENMMNAIRKCMEREKEWQKADAEKASEEPEVITIKIRQFLMRSLNLDSRIITGKVIKETPRAWLIEGHADMLENMSWCVRCGRQLTEPASQVTGMGATCAEKMMMPYDTKGVLAMSKKEREKIRKQFVKKLQAQKFEEWIPKSQVEEVL